MVDAERLKGFFKRCEGIASEEGTRSQIAEMAACVDRLERASIELGRRLRAAEERSHRSELARLDAERDREKAWVDGHEAGYARGFEDGRGAWRG